MVPLAWILIGLVMAVAVFLPINFRFLLYPLFTSINPVLRARRLRLEGTVLFISDLHLNADFPFAYSQNIRSVLLSKRVSHIIINGDLFNSPRDAASVLNERAASSIDTVLGYADLPVKVFFVQGSPPHDPKPNQGNVLDWGAIIRLGECAMLEFDHVRVVVYHGHDLSVKGAVGHGWDRFISGLSLERAWKRFAGVNDTDWAIFGHTHIPGIDQKKRVANCGGWQSIPYLVHPTRTGLLLTSENSSLELVNFAS